jgi:hypothetical protein
MKTVRIVIVSLLIVLLLSAYSEAGWLIYHEPEFQGTIVDIDSKQPIEGAVIVAEYRKATMGLGAGSMSSIIDVRETLTDKDGHFRIPSYTTLIQPFSWQIPTIFIIFKPGYASLKLGLKEYFTGHKSDELKGSYPWSSELIYRVIGPGIVEIPKVKTKEEREKARMSVDIFGADVKESELPIFNKIIKEEYQGGF